MNRKRIILGTGVRAGERGFTIVELLIATLVFSMVLLVITIGVLSFTKAYYKGITQSNTQNTARTIIENISQAIQFSGDDITTPIGTTGSNGSIGFCIGNTRYSYLLGYQLTEGTPGSYQAKHAIVSDTSGSCSGLNAQNIKGSPTGKELLAPHMRLSKLSVQRIGTSNVYKINVKVVYGDLDLLSSPSGASPVATATDATCQIAYAGSQFCAVSELTTTVQKRIE